MNSINVRRSCRSFKAKPVEEEKVDKILRAAMQAPSGRKELAWEFYVISNQEMRTKLANLAPQFSNVETAGLAIIPISNRQRYKKHWDYEQQDLAAATQNILLTATEEGLCSLWQGVTPREDLIAAVSEVLGLDKHMVPFAIISVGYGSKDDINHFIDRYQEDRLHWLR